jgi:uncharacterized RDD family membrane protein YckC
VARWTGDWISGLASGPAEGDWPGRRLGLPEEGAGAVASIVARFGALVVDLVVGALIGALVNAYLGDPSALERTLAVNGSFALQVIVLQSLTGQSIGMRLVGIRVARLADPAAAPGFLPVAIRTALLFLVLPAVVMDRDGRGLHDKAGGTIVLEAR